MSKRMRSARGASAFVRPDSMCHSTTDARIGSTGAVSAEASCWNELIDKLFHMESFEDDWDAEGTVAPPLPLVHGAIRLAQILRWENQPPAERVIASVNGTIYFEWHTSLGYEEIEVISPRDAEQRKVKVDSDVLEVLRFTF